MGNISWDNCRLMPYSSVTTHGSHCSCRMSSDSARTLPFCCKEMLTPQYYAPLSHKRFPNIRLASNPQPVVMSTEDYFWFLSKINHEDHPLFWDPEPDHAVSLGAHLLPQGLLFAFSPFQETAITPQVLRAHRQLVADATTQILTGERRSRRYTNARLKLTFIGRYLKKEVSLLKPPECIKPV